MAAATDSIKLVLAGDVMIGRGIDQIMPSPVSPALFEPWVRDAREYVHLAERTNGAITQPVALDYPWGDALGELRRLGADLRIVNLETAITSAGSPWPGKGIHYRMSPAHVGCLSSAGIDACALANNHLLDWGREGLHDTLAALAAAGVATAGAGTDLARAEAPALLALEGGRRVLLFSWAAPDSGVPDGWAATADRPGVALLRRLDETAAQSILRGVERQRGSSDLVVVSLHWGGNWVDVVPAAQRRFARRLIDIGAADVVHGHSSHHPLPIEVHAGKLILYGCGDLINDYEGIAPRGHLRSDLGCLYAATLGRADGRLRSLEVVPLQLRRFRLSRPTAEASAWLLALLRASRREFGTRVEPDAVGRWNLAWNPARDDAGAGIAPRRPN